MQQGFSDSDLDRLAIPFYFSHKLGALYRGDAKGCKVLLVGIFREPAFGLLLDKECRQLILRDLEEKVEVLAGTAREVQIVSGQRRIGLSKDLHSAPIVQDGTSERADVW